MWSALTCSSLTGLAFNWFHEKVLANSYLGHRTLWLPIVCPLEAKYLTWFFQRKEVGHNYIYVSKICIGCIFVFPFQSHTTHTHTDPSYTRRPYHHTHTHSHTLKRKEKELFVLYSFLFFPSVLWNSKFYHLRRADCLFSLCLGKGGNPPFFWLSWEVAKDYLACSLLGLLSVQLLSLSIFYRGRSGIWTQILFWAEHGFRLKICILTVHPPGWLYLEKVSLRK